MKTKLVALLISLSALFIGCANNQPQIKKEIVVKNKNNYYYDDNIKKAVAILIYKQNALEKKVANLSKQKLKFKSVPASCSIKLNKKAKLCSKRFDKNAIYIAIGNVNVRECPSIYSKIIKKLKKGEKVKFTYCNKYCWCNLKSGGYVYKKLFKIERKINLSKAEKLSNKQKFKSQNKENKKEKLNVDKIINDYINSK